MDLIIVLYPIQCVFDTCDIDPSVQPQECICYPVFVVSLSLT